MRLHKPIRIPTLAAGTGMDFGSNTDILVSADGTVVWDDKQGKAGITFE
jgi:hypothetical protein